MKPPVTATLTWQGDLRFSAQTPRTEIILDSDSTAGPSPPEALAMALAGCMAIDVADIVIKGRHPLTALEAQTARRAARRSAAPLRQLHAAFRRRRRRARRTPSSARFSSRATSTARCGIRCGRTSSSTPRFEVSSCSVRSISTGCAASPSIIMVGAHVTDAWTRDRRSRPHALHGVRCSSPASPRRCSCSWPA